MKITDLISELKTSGKGYARQNRFSVMIPELQVGELLCTAINMPSRNISTGEYAPGSVTRKFAYSHIDGEVTLTFNNTANYEVYKFFIEWMQKIVNTEDYTLGYKKGNNGYAKPIELMQNDTTDTETYTCLLENAYPINISQIDLSDASENAIVNFTVTMSYDRFSYNK